MSESNPNKCLHCGELVDEHLNVFCCRGCQLSYQLIKSLNLQSFYGKWNTQEKSKIASSNMSSVPSIPSAKDLLGHQQDYSVFDQLENKKKFISSEDKNKAEFYLDGLTCYSCVWLLEKAIPRFDPYSKLKINLTQAKASLCLSDDSKPLSALFEVIENLGFRILHAPDQKLLSTEIVKMAVALFLASNLMMLSLAEYFDALGEMSLGFQNFIHGLSWVLGTVVYSYCGSGILLSAWQSLKLRTTHIDQPIAFGLTFTYLYSTFQAFSQSSDIYFDSLATIIAFLLVGRVLQSRLLERAQRSILKMQEAGPSLSRKLSSVDDIHETLIENSHILKGDILKFIPGDMVAVDLCVLSSLVECFPEALNGELKSIWYRRDEHIPSGFIVGAYPLLGQALQNGTESTLYKVSSEIADILSQKPGRYQRFSDKFSRIFFITLLAFSGFSLLYYWPDDHAKALHIMMSILLVACPCAFGLASTLIFSLALAQGLKNKVVFRNIKSIESLASIKKFIFDKTGTLTCGEREVVDARFHKQVSPSFVYNAVTVAARHSHHHDLHSLKKWSNSQDLDGCVDLTTSFSTHSLNFKEHFSQGCSFQDLSGKIYRIGRHSFCVDSTCESDNHSQYTCFLSCDGFLLVEWILDDRLREGAKELISNLTDQVDIKEVLIASGDSSIDKASLSQELALDEKQIFSGLSLYDKWHQAQNVATPFAFVGNGFNDALVMAAAELSICVKSGSSLPKSHADIYLLSDNLMTIYEAIKISERVHFAFKTTFMFALIYNLTVLTLAFLGFVQPWFAAILMPISSAVVIYLSTRAFARSGD